MTLARVAREAFEYIKDICPYDSGNMHNTIRFEKVGKDTYRIRINPNNTAPYAVYTNERWISPKWNFAHNPNEKWIDEGAQSIAHSIAVKLDGSVTSATGENERWENKNYYDSIIDSR